MRHLPLVLCALLTSAPAFARRPPRFFPAQPPVVAAPSVVPPAAAPPGSLAPPAAVPPTVEPLRNNVRGRVRAMVLDRISRELGLDPATAARVGAVYDTYAAREVPFRQQIRRSRRGLIAITRRGAPADDATINSLVDGMASGRAQLAAIDQERSQVVRRLLTPRQFAQLTLLLPLIKAEIHRDLRRVLQGGVAPAGADPNAPATIGEDDDELE